jgi:hypothetical protein
MIQPRALSRQPDGHCHAIRDQASGRNTLTLINYRRCSALWRGRPPPRINASSTTCKLRAGLVKFALEIKERLCLRSPTSRAALLNIGNH